MENWKMGFPKNPGCYLLEFSDGKRFVFARFDGERLENMEDHININCAVSRHLPVVDPDMPATISKGIIKYYLKHEEKRALRYVMIYEGRKWKFVLRQMWETGNYGSYSRYADILQYLRNAGRFGVKGLDRVKPKDLETFELKVQNGQ